MQFGGCGAHVPTPLAMDGPHDIIADPVFVSITLGSEDFQLQDGSPAIDGGDPDPMYDDLYFPPSKGTVRNDMGAYGGTYPIDDSEIPETP